MKRGKIGEFVFGGRGDGRSVSAANILTRRGRCVGKSINESRSIWREDRGVRAIFLGQARKARAIESDAIELPLKRRFFRGGEVNEILCFVDGVDRLDLPVTFCKLR